MPTERGKYGNPNIPGWSDELRLYCAAKPSAAAANTAEMQRNDRFRRDDLPKLDAPSGQHKTIFGR
jgi:hypothetical protein